MTLVPGARLGEYEIVSAIGAGGMGEVYRARDTSLGREVAIKVLPASFAADPDRLARFGREARLLASLNHPAIATLHGFHTEADTRFLVMELVEGETLGDRLHRGPLPVRKALDLFIAIARGLEAAHEKGVIHRDLKPANLKLLDGSTGDTLVKILDFGLAKAMASDGDSDPALTHSPTLTLAATLRGEVLGTAAYMSPEQAKGRPVDRRTDVFAFGACLYEALTARRAFDGDSVTEIMAAVLKVEPDLDALPAEAGPALRRLLRRCLTKDAAERLHDIADARLELQRIAREGDGDTTVGSTARRTAWLSAGVGALAGALLAAGLVLLRGESGPADPPSSYLNLALPSGQRLDLSSPSSIAISADGRHIVYAGRDDSGTRLYHRSLDGTKVVPLPGTEEARSVSSFSPDGAIAFSRGETLLTVGLDGESPRVVTEASQPRGVAWDEAGRLLFGQRGGTLHRIARDGGKVEELLPKPDVGDRRSPEPVPGRNAVVFVNDNTRPDHPLQVVDLDDGVVRDLTSGTSARFLSPEVLLWVREGALWAGRFDAQALALHGEPRRVVTGLATNTFGIGWYDVSDNGTLVFASGGDEGSRNGLFWVDRQGRRSSLGLAPVDYQGPELSPDGSTLLFTIADASGLNVWTLDLDRGVLSRLTFGGLDVSSTWSPDGRRVYFASFGDAPGVYSRAADGTGEVTLHYRAEAAHGRPLVADATLDGSGLILIRQLEENWDILDLALTEGSKPRPLLAESYGELSPELSPDGRWLAYQSNESGTWQVYVRPYPDVAIGKWQISTAGAREPVWSPDGDELFFRRGRELRSVAVESGAAFRVGPEQLVLEVDTLVLGPPQYDAHPDGRFIFVTEMGDSDREPAQIVVIEHFDREVERLLARP